MTKRKYYETVHTHEYGVVLVVTDNSPNVAEVWCKAYVATNKKITAPKFHGYYYITELREAVPPFEEFVDYPAREVIRPFYGNQIATYAD